MTLGREFLTNRDAKRAKLQLEAGENSIWKPDFNKGQMLPAVLLLESLNLLQFLTPDVQLRGTCPISPEIFHLPIRATTPLVSALSHYLNINKTLTLLKI
ncbi:MAG: hypothetical protein V7K67_20685 [Nostoc sp.]|uniref:hypothetical protein n=1 Tax=Nostoc sp. TaxID=1180 RepID=UPI002FF7005D